MAEEQRDHGTIVSSEAQILRMLARGLCPLTDNEDALVALGFSPLYPGTAGRERHVWGRCVDRGAAADGHRRLGIERAYLMKRRAIA